MGDKLHVKNGFSQTASKDYASCQLFILRKQISLYIEDVCTKLVDYSTANISADVTDNHGGQSSNSSCSSMSISSEYMCPPSTEDLRA